MSGHCDDLETRYALAYYHLYNTVIGGYPVAHFLRQCFLLGKRPFSFGYLNSLKRSIEPPNALHCWI